MTIAHINATDETIRATALAIGRAAIFDDFFGHEDDARTAAWSEAIQKYELQAPDLLNAVTDFYAGTPQGRLTIGELIRLGRQSRQDNAMRREHAEREERGIRAELVPASTLAASDRQLGGLPINADGDPVWSAYEANGAIDRECPTCKQPPDHACINLATDTARKIPCLSRLKAQG